MQASESGSTCTSGSPPPWPITSDQGMAPAGPVARYARGDLAAARILTARLGPRILGFSARMLSDAAEAEDVTQETMLRLWRIAPDWQDGQAQVSTWAFRVAANLCTDRLRKRRSVALDMVDEPPDDAPGAVATWHLQLLSPVETFVNGRADCAIRITAGNGATRELEFKLLGPR